MDVYEIVFKGEIMPTLERAGVSTQLASLFNAPLERISALFDGQPHTLKSGLDRAQAERYRAALRDAGAIVYLRRTQSSRQSAPRAAAATAAQQPLSVTPPGYLLRDGERRQVAPVVVDTSGLALSAQGDANLAPPSAEPPAAPDTSHITLAAAGALLLEGCPPPPPATPDTSHLQLEPAGPLLQPHERPQPAPPPSLALDFDLAD